MKLFLDHYLPKKSQNDQKITQELQTDSFTLPSINAGQELPEVKKSISFKQDEQRRSNLRWNSESRPKTTPSLTAKFRSTNESTRNTVSSFAHASEVSNNSEMFNSSIEASTKPLTKSLRKQLVPIVTEIKFKSNEDFRLLLLV